jgi:diguanylate cyclase
VDAEHALNRAIERREFCLYYQPEWDVLTGRMAAVEALVRWQDPERGLIGPEGFIEVAEETGMIERLGAWVLREALAQGLRWRHANPTATPVVMSVNVSARQLHLKSLVASVSAALRDTGTDPSLLCLEITESAAMSRVESTLGVLSELKALGVKLAIDDFGTGYSSLAYLREFPMDVLKIDRSLVSGLDRSRESASIVAAVIGLAQALGLSAVAEGIEEVGEMSELRRLGCDLAQGYLLGRPQPPDALEGTVATSTTHHAFARAG